MKKMKKRRELDALVNGKLGRKKTKGQHELLRDDSESSDVEEFSIPEQAVVRKRSTSRFCATCLMGCGFFLLLACLVAVAGLVWVHVELKRDVDQLQNSFRRLEDGSQSNPEEFQDLHTSQQILEKKLEELTNGDGGIVNLQKSIEKALNKIMQLNATTTSLSKSLAAAPELKNLPKTVQQLSQETAAMGSNIHTLQLDVNTLQGFKNSISTQVDMLSASIHSVQNQSSVPTEGDRDQSPGATPAFNTYVQEELMRISTAIDTLNSSVTSQFGLVTSHSMEHKMQLDEFLNSSLVLDSRLSLLEMRSSPLLQPNLTANMMQGIVQQAVNSVMEELKNYTADRGDEALEGLSQEIQDLQTRVSQLETSTPNPTSNTTTSITRIEQTLMELQNAVGNLTSSQAQLMGTVSPLLPRITALEEGSALARAGSTVSAEGQEKTPIGGESEQDGLVEAGKTSVKPQTQGVDEIGPSTTTSPPATSALLTLPWVTSQEDAIHNIRRWDLDGDGYVNYVDLNDFLGPFVPTETQLSQYDANMDNKYDLDEMLSAFGYAPYKRPTEDEQMGLNATETEGEAGSQETQPPFSSEATDQGEQIPSMEGDESTQGGSQEKPLQGRRSVKEQRVNHAEDLDDFLSNLKAQP